MADGFKIEIDGEQAAQVAAAAKARGMAVEDYVRATLQLMLDNEASSPDTSEDQAAFEEYERTGLAVPHEEVLAWLKSLSTGAPLPKPQLRKMK